MARYKFYIVLYCIASMVTTTDSTEYCRVYGFAC